MLDAAIDLVGTEGLRSLTHARVDERAGVPKGTTSNYFRSRKALLLGVVGRIEELEQAGDVAERRPPATADEFIDQVCALVEHVTGTNRVHTTARLALFIEASHDAELRDAISGARARMEGGLVVAMAGLGSPDPHTAAGTIAACAEGLILHRIARHDATDPRPVLDLVVRAGLGLPRE